MADVRTIQTVNHVIGAGDFLPLFFFRLGFHGFAERPTRPSVVDKSGLGLMTRSWTSRNLLGDAFADGKKAKPDKRTIRLICVESVDNREEAGYTWRSPERRCGGK